jgi:hypothetical protein
MLLPFLSARKFRLIYELEVVIQEDCRNGKAATVAWRRERPIATAVSGAQKSLCR